MALIEQAQFNFSLQRPIDHDYFQHLTLDPVNSNVINHILNKPKILTFLQKLIIYCKEYLGVEILNICDFEYLFEYKVNIEIFAA